jgi:enoyl-CoA hydratase/carnithine racemase
MSYKTLLVEKNKSIATISFNRPQKLNAFDKEMVLETQDIIESVTHDDAVKVVIITGIGKGFFSRCRSW